MIKHLYREVIDKWGVDAQLDVAIEELSELIKEICKVKRGLATRVDLAEELADVEIMCEQLRFIYGIDDEVNKWKDYKLKRLEKRLDD